MADRQLTDGLRCDAEGSDMAVACIDVADPCYISAISGGPNAESLAAMAEDMALRLLMASPALDVATGLVIGRLVHHDIDALLAVQDGRDRAREAVGAIRKRGW